MEAIQYYHAPLGRMILVSDGEALTGAWFNGQKYFETAAEKWKERKLPVFDQTKKWLDIYFQGKEPDFMPPLAMKGTPFRQAVWEILLEIPFGGTMTYGEIAERIARQRGMKKMAAQAVGGAVGHNPISILVPCHRVVGTNGKLTGYGGGIEKKAWLLELEKKER